MRDLTDYLCDFLRRSQPLMDLDKALSTIGQEVQQQWDDGTMREWEETVPNPLWCEACEKRFAKETVAKAHLQGKKHARAEHRAQQRAEQRQAHAKEVFLAEATLSRLADQLSDVFDATKANVEKKQARTLRERMEAQREQDESEESDESDDEDEVVKQIKNYPTDWDGEPIPYWLYRLHGLGVEYKCEICGNTSYWGLRAFDRHFQEWRHAHGMKMLGIPNTEHFHNVVTIKDAVALHKKLLSDVSSKEWDPDEGEEFEDAEGNVYDRKTYQLMKQQGMIDG